MLSSTDQREPMLPGSTAMSAWAGRLLFLRIFLITVLLIGILFWLSSKVIVVLLILLVAGCLLAVLSEDACRRVSVGEH